MSWKKKCGSKVMGVCAKEMQICKCPEPQFLCPDCHQVDAGGYLVRKDSKPEYDGDSRPCTWKGKKMLYAAHNKRYHASTKNNNHLIGFKKPDSGHIHKQCINRLRAVKKIKPTRNKRNERRRRNKGRGKQNYNDGEWILISFKDVHSKWYRWNNKCDDYIHIKNLSFYLKRVVDAYYSYKNDRNGDCIKLGTYSRIFCEYACKFLLKNDYSDLSLEEKIERVNKTYFDKSFPLRQVQWVREKTNIFVYSVEYGTVVKGGYLSKKECDQMVISIGELVKWIEVYLKEYYCDSVN